MKQSIGFVAQRRSGDVGNGGPHRRDERPVHRAGRHARLFTGLGLGPLVDPGFDELDLGLGQRRPIERHAVGRPFAAQGLDQRALRALARQHGRTAFAPGQGCRRRVEPQPAAGLGRAVASHTMLGQDRLDLTRVIHRLGADWRETVRAASATSTQIPATSTGGRPKPVKSAPIRRCTLPIRGIAGGGKEGKRRGGDPVRTGESFSPNHRAYIKIPQATCSTPAISAAETQRSGTHFGGGAGGRVLAVTVSGPGLE